jgi:hypothetical protein
MVNTSEWYLIYSNVSADFKTAMLLLLLAVLLFNGDLR